MTIEEILARGGIVVWLLGGYSVIALTIIVERLLFFSFQPNASAELEQQLTSAFADQSTPPLHPEQLLRQQKECPETRLIHSLLRTRSCDSNLLTQTASRIGTKERNRQERGFRTLHILGNTAPLLGLFGTVLGMIKAFMVIEQAGGRVDAQALAGGIWEAMITTGVGLAVSLAILLLLHLLEGISDRRMQNLQYYANVALDLLCRQAPQTPKRAGTSGVIHAV